jgi:hypothetical protein
MELENNSDTDPILGLSDPLSRVSDPDSHSFWNWILIRITVQIQELSRLKNGVVEGQRRSKWRG